MHRRKQGERKQEFARETGIVAEDRENEFVQVTGNVVEDRKNEFAIETEDRNCRRRQKEDFARGLETGGLRPPARRFLLGDYFFTS